MTPRQTLDRAVSRVTGADIRLVGNWSKLWCLQHRSREIAEELRLDESDLLKCRDITDILNLMGGTHRADVPASRQQTLSLF